MVFLFLLEALITTVVRRVVREELYRDYYVDEYGTKVLYAADEATSAYLAELQEDYEAIQRGEVELSSICSIQPANGSWLTI